MIPRLLFANRPNTDLHEKAVEFFPPCNLTYDCCTRSGNRVGGPVTSFETVGVAPNDGAGVDGEYVGSDVKTGEEVGDGDDKAIGGIVKGGGVAMGTAGFEVGGLDTGVDVKDVKGGNVGSVEEGADVIAVGSGVDNGVLSGEVVGLGPNVVC